MIIGARFAAAGIFAIGTLTAADVSSASVTFNKDVLPILEKNCQSCHRPGQIAPMSFLSYETTRPWAKAMKNAIATKKMPPWFADPQYGHFANERSLKQSDIDTLVKWADNGAPQGDPKDAPLAVQWPENGWQIKPDLILNGPEYKVPAKGIVEWTNIVMPGFTKDTWIASIEIRPSEPAVTHHICVTFRPHKPDVEYGVPRWIDKKRDESGSELPREAQIGGGNNGIEDCYVPGTRGRDFRPFHAGKLVPAGTDIVWQIHYTTNGKEVVDRPQIGFTVTSVEPERRYLSLNMQAPRDAKSFAIPPNDGDWESPIAEGVFEEDAEMVWMMPHMHLRGKDMRYTLEYPDGRKEVILNVPHYDFNWQIGYITEHPIKLPKGTRIVVTAHYDNSVNNKFNPDPNRVVYAGDQTWEEMMAPFFSVTVDKTIDPDKVLKTLGKTLRGSGA